MPTPRTEADVTRGRFTLEVDGEALPFDLSVNDWCDAEDRLGLSMADILKGLATSARLSHLRVLTALGLSTPGMVYDEKEAGQIIGKLGMQTIIEQIGANVEAIMGTPATKKVPPVAAGA